MAQLAQPTVSLRSVSTIEVCSQEFGTSTITAQNATDAVCGDAQDSEMTILSFAVTPDQEGGATTLEFNALPPPSGQSSGNPYDNDQPCKSTPEGQECRVFGKQPLSITISSSPSAIAYKLQQITDPFPIQYGQYSSLAQWSEDDEDGAEKGFTAKKLLDPDSEIYACTLGYEEGVTRFGGMHDTNGGNYQFPGGNGCSDTTDTEDPYSLRCVKDSAKCQLPIASRVWCTQRHKGSQYVNNYLTLHGACASASPNVRWYPHQSLRRDWWDPDPTDDDDESFGGACVVCRAEYSDNRYMSGLFGNERKCNTLMQDFRQCFVESLDTAYSDAGAKDVEVKALCPSGEVEGELCNNPDVDNNALVCLDAPPGHSKDVESCSFYAPPQSCQQFLAPCNPFTTGTTCWGSYNQPEGFYKPKKGADPNPGMTQGFLGTRGKNRGASLTQFWLHSEGGSPAYSGQQWNEAHLYRCGHFCTSMPFVPRPVGDNPDKHRFSTQNEAGYVKGWFGLGPMCRAFAVERRGEIQSSVTFTATLTQADGSDTTAKLKVSSDDVANGDSLAVDPSIKGIAAKLNGPSSVTGRVSSDLGGILVICGAEPVSDTAGLTAAPGTINGVLSESWDVRDNPWMNLVSAIQLASAETSMGKCNTGCPVPVAPLITALQCFACDTASYAPRDVCKALKKVCDKEENEHLGCKVPISFSDDKDCSDTECPDCETTTKDICICESCGSDQCKVLDFWDGTNSEVPRGVAWMWYPEETRSAFGKECGQYGMNPSTFGRDEATGQFVCTSPGASVPCIPGLSANAPSTGVTPPCAVLGGLTDYFCRTSTSSATSDTISSICGADKAGSGCGSDKAGQVPLPQGVMSDWSIGAPQYWVHRGRVYKQPEQNSTFTMDVDLYVNGFALNADVENVSPGKFVNAGAVACILTKGSTTGTSYVAVENTGTLVADYRVDFDGCLGANGQQSVSVAPSGSSQQQVTVSPGADNVEQVKFALSTPEGASFSAATCKYVLRSFARPNLVFDRSTYGCSVTVPSSRRQPGSSGLPALQETGEEPSPDDCADPGFFCWIAFGSVWSKVFVFTFLGLMALLGLVFIAYGIKWFRENTRNERAQMAARSREEVAQKLEFGVEREKAKALFRVRERQQEKMLTREEIGLPGLIGQGIKAALKDVRTPSTQNTDNGESSVTGRSHPRASDSYATDTPTQRDVIE